MNANQDSIKVINTAELLSKLSPDNLATVADLVAMLAGEPPTTEAAPPVEDDDAHLTSREDLLLTADEYFLGVVTSDHDLENNDDYEYRDLADFKPLIDEGLLELERTEIRTNGATVDVYALTAKGRFELHLLKTTDEAAPASEPEPENEQEEEAEELSVTDFGDAFHKPIEHLSRYIFAHLLMGYTGYLLFEKDRECFGDSWEEIRFLYDTVLDGVRHALPGIGSKELTDAIYACENKAFY